MRLRLRPEGALRLRASERESRVELISYVALLLDDPQRAENARLPMSELPLAGALRLAGVLGLLPEEPVLALPKSRARPGRKGSAIGAQSMRKLAKDAYTDLIPALRDMRANGLALRAITARLNAGATRPAAAVLGNVTAKQWRG